MIVMVVIFATASISFAQVSVENLNYAEKDSAWSKDAVELWNEYSVKNPYAKEVKITDVKAEDIVTIYKVSNLSESRKMISDTVTGTTIPEYPTQWMIVYTLNGEPVAFVTYDDPTKNGNDVANIVKLMAAGLHQGDDDETTTDSSNDAKFAPSDDEDLEIPDDF